LLEIWEVFLFILGEEMERESMYGQPYGGGGEEELGSGVFTHRKGMVEGPGKGFKVGGVGCGWSSLVRVSQRNGPAMFTDAKKP